MKVLSVIAAPQRRGAEIFASGVRDRLRDAGHDVRLVALEPSDDELPGVEVLGNGRAHPTTLAKLLRASREADVAISNGGSTLLPVVAAGTTTRTPVAYRNIGDPTAWATSRSAALRVGTALRRCAAVVALYDEARTELLRLYRLDPACVPTINNAVDATPFRPDDLPSRREACRALDWRDDRRRVLVVGALSPEKRPLLACDVADGLPEDVETVLVGGGPLRAEVAARVERSNGRLRLLPPTEGLTSLYRASDVALSTSATEGMPGVMIEAAFCERARVGPACGGVPDVIADGRDGRLLRVDATPAEWIGAVTDALSQPQWGTAAARRASEEWDLDAAATAWERVLQAVVDDDARGSRPDSLAAVSAALNATKGS